MTVLEDVAGICVCVNFCVFLCSWCGGKGVDGCGPSSCCRNRRDICDDGGDQPGKRLLRRGVANRVHAVSYIGDVANRAFAISYIAYVANCTFTVSYTETVNRMPVTEGSCGRSVILP